MGISYQDIESRLSVIERKVDFIMRSFSLTRQEQTPLGGYYVNHDIGRCLPRVDYPRIHDYRCNPQ